MNLQWRRRLFLCRTEVRAELLLPPFSLEQLSRLQVGGVLPWKLAPALEHGVIYSLSGSGWSGRFFTVPVIVESVKQRIVVRLVNAKTADSKQNRPRVEFPMLRVNRTTELQVSIVLGALSLTVRELLFLKPGDVFSFRAPLDQTATLMVGEEELARVCFERDGERVQVRIDTLLESSNGFERK